MKYIHYLFLFSIGSLLLSSCGPRLTPFSQELYDQNDWSERELKRIQFYLSDDIVLTRSVSRGESSIREGKIRTVNGRRVQEIRIDAGTPGVLLFMPKENRFAISFEENDKLYLMFGPNPKIGGRYALLARDWERRVGRVHYNNKLYNVDATSAIASLMVDLKRIGKTDYNVRRAKGRVVK